MKARFEVTYLDPTKDHRPIRIRVVEAPTPGQARNKIRKLYPGYYVAFAQTRMM